MITGMSVGKNGLQTVLVDLQTSTFTFQLTGSRYFGTNSEYSDYDFFVQDDLKSHYDVYGVRQSLVDKGFDLEFSHNDEYSSDISIVDVYKHPCGVHVQIVKDFEVKKTAQSSLFVQGVGIDLTNKDLVKRLWTLALTFAEQSKPESRSYVGRERALAAIVGAANKDKIQSIVAYRGMTGESFKESKEAVETIYWFKK